MVSRELFELYVQLKIFKKGLTSWAECGMQGIVSIVCTIQKT